MLKKLLDKLPNDARCYPSWLLWLLVAGLKSWCYFGFKSAKNFYWNKDTICRM